MQIEHKDKVALRPHCLELLDYLKNNGYPIWLATNADCAGLAFKLDHLNLRDYFDVIVSSETIGHAKRIYRILARPDMHCIHLSLHMLILLMILKKS